MALCSVARHCIACHIMSFVIELDGMAWHGIEWLCMALQDMALYGVEWCDMAWHAVAWCEMALHGVAWR